ncbi:MAG: ATP-binding protein [Porphyromonadaceae bacterium]|nr:ATP-binding protein [Porphyromonadaceae bacterium]
MNKNIIRIALTGGPCAGKTTALAKIIERFSDLGYLVYALPETPTIFSNASINFATPDKQYFYNIEKAVLKYQIQMEDTFLELARSAQQPVLIIADRGTMDISAYMEPTIWQAMLDELGLSEVKLRDARYDAVIHMVTAAIGAEDFYTTTNNSARHESVEQARELDNRIMKAWTGHPQLHIVENNVDFDVKIERTLRAIQSATGNSLDPSLAEVRHKLLVRLVGEIPYGVETEIYQTYINNEDGSSTRLRKRGLRGNYVYFMSQKHKLGQGCKSIITERQISPDEYLVRINRITDSSAFVVHKLRKSFIWAKQYFELDSLIEPKEGLHLLEVKTEQGIEIKLPPFLQLVEDVSELVEYERL